TQEKNYAHVANIFRTVWQFTLSWSYHMANHYNTHSVAISKEPSIAEFYQS
ncbi:hypothetical protein CRM22_000563, partial [Opisthorchis felineus]